MKIVRVALARLTGMFDRDSRDRDLAEELASHMELHIDDNLRSGMTPEEAVRAAKIRLGSIESIKEDVRERRGFPVLQSVLQDIRYALRGMGRSPGFTTVAVMTLAVAIGINAAVFTIAGTVLFGGYPRVDPDNRIFYTSVGLISNPEFEDWKAQTKSFSGIAGVQNGGLRLVLQDDSGNSETCDTTQLSTNAFQVLSQRPIVGRDFAPSDGVAGAPSVALLNYAFWERRFAKDPSVIGKAFRLDDKPVTVVGVMPPGFTFPTPRVDLWIQIVPDRDRPMFFWFAFVRLAKGATRKSAQAEMDTIARRLESSYPLKDFDPRLRSFGEQFWGVKGIALYRAIWGAVGFLFLIGCANLANLLLARAIGRHREISLRIALGAGRWRIIRQLLIESLMLSSIAAVLGWFIALVSVRIYERIESPPGLYNQYQYVLDYHVLLYLVAISILAGLLFGMAPAVRLSKLDVNGTLKDGGRGATGGMSGKRLSALLVTAEIAVTIVLLAGAGLMARSFLKIYKEDIGATNTPNILVASVGLPATRYPDAQSRMAFFDRLTTKLKSIPGLDSVALADSLPGLNAFRLPYELAGSPAVDEQRRPMSLVITITPDYFRTVGAAMISGRDFNDFDRASTPPVALVSELFAREHWAGVNPLGKRLRLFDGRNADAWRTIVGVSSNIVQGDWGGNESGQVVYVPYRQRPPAFSNILALTRVPPGSLAETVRRGIQPIDSGRWRRNGRDRGTSSFGRTFQDYSLLVQSRKCRPVSHFCGYRAAPRRHWTLRRNRAFGIEGHPGDRNSHRYWSHVARYPLAGAPAGDAARCNRSGHRVGCVGRLQPPSPVPALLGIVHGPSHLRGDFHRPNRGGSVCLPDSGTPCDARRPCCRSET
jgi:putative ABC transport system permease protein